MDRIVEAKRRGGKIVVDNRSNALRGILQAKGVTSGEGSCANRGAAVGRDDLQFFVMLIKQEDRPPLHFEEIPEDLAVNQFLTQATTPAK